MQNVAIESQSGTRQLEVSSQPPLLASQRSAFTVEEILRQPPGTQRRPSASARRKAAQPHYAPPRRRYGVFSWAIENPWTAAIAAYATWLAGWGAYVWTGLSA